MGLEPARREGGREANKSRRERKRKEGSLPWPAGRKPSERLLSKEPIMTPVETTYDCGSPSKILKMRRSRATRS